MEEKSDLKKQYDLLYENISRKLDQQLDNLASIDTKASILITTIGVLFAGYLQLLVAQDITFKNYKIFVILEVICFLVAGLFIFKAFFLNKEERWRIDPRPIKLVVVFSKNSDKGEYWLKDQIIKSMVVAYEENDRLIIRKYNFFLKARNILYFGIIILVFHLAMLLFNASILSINLTNMTDENKQIKQEEPPMPKPQEATHRPEVDLLNQIIKGGVGKKDDK